MLRLVAVYAIVHIYMYVYIYLRLLRGYILAEFSINQTDVSSTYRVERERENNASFENMHNKKRDIISLSSPSLPSSP